MGREERLAMRLTGQGRVWRIERMLGMQIGKALSPIRGEG